MVQFFQDGLELSRIVVKITRWVNDSKLIYSGGQQWLMMRETGQLLPMMANHSQWLKVISFGRICLVLVEQEDS